MIPSQEPRPTSGIMLQVRIEGALSGAGEYRFAARKQLRSGAITAFLERAQSREGAFVGTGFRRRLENRSRLTRVRIEAEDEKFGRECAEVDLTVDERLGLVIQASIGRVGPGGGVLRRRARLEQKVNVLGNLVGARPEPGHAER